MLSEWLHSLSVTCSKPHFFSEMVCECLIPVVIYAIVQEAFKDHKKLDKTIQFVLMLSVFSLILLGVFDLLYKG